MNDDPRRQLFSESWYVTNGPAFEGEAFAHFLSEGWREGRDPHPLFDVRFYLEQLPGSLEHWDDPLGHFIRAGAAAGVDPHPLFDVSYYMATQAGDLGGLDPLTYHLKEGWKTGEDPHPLFDTSYYWDRYPQVAGSGANPVTHYAMRGRDLDLVPHPMFSPHVYAAYRNLAPGVNPLVDFVLSLRRVSKRPASANPSCSAIILNFNKSVLTLQCLVEAVESDRSDELEIIVVDNGSAPGDFELLTRLVPAAARIIRLQTNRFFGEGNNIGVEASRAEKILFLNNDAFLGRRTWTTLAQVLDTYPDAGAVGPKFLYPSGRIQEAGAFIDSTGIALQRGKHLENDPECFSGTDVVDYVSAACLMMPRSDFDRVAGFDLAWDPAYYEDVDLCLKLRLFGKRTYYCGAAEIVHMENGTSSDQSLGLKLGNIVEVNREKFISRWASFLDSGGSDTITGVRLPPMPVKPRPRPGLAVLFTPYALVPGGGERYVLTIAAMLSRLHRTVIVTPETYSYYRLRTLGQELDLDLSAIELLPRARMGEVSECDLFIALGNEVLPQIPATGLKRIFICQFPFPMHPNHVADAWGRLDDYDLVVVYSQFAAEHFRRRARAVTRRDPPPVAILAPPVPDYYDPFAGPRTAGRILSVGRFASAGHCKRQDTLIDAFEDLLTRPGGREIELHLAGSVASDPSAREYLLMLRKRAARLPVYFHVNAPPNTLRHLYQSSSLYWHGAGFGVLEKHFPERLEHFGISVIEAMSAGTIPMVCANGGPSSIVDDGRTGFHWTTPHDLADKANRILSAPSEVREGMRDAARAEASRYSADALESNLFLLLDEWDVRWTADVPVDSYLTPAPR